MNITEVIIILRKMDLRSALIVDIDGDGDALSAGFEAFKRSLLVGNDEGNV